MVSVGKRLKVMMVCAHEPTLDPRIRWEAEGASSRFDVTVLGFNHSDRPLAESEKICGCRVVRLKPQPVSALYYLRQLTGIMPRTTSLLLLAALYLLSPALLAGEGLAWLARMARDRVDPSTKTRIGGEKTRIWSGLHLTRGHLAARFLSIFWLLRRQFATATSLFWDYLSRAPVKPDVVHCNDLDTLLVGVLAKQHYGCRVIFDAHEFYPRSDPDGSWLDVTFFTAIERLLIRRADAVATVNPLLAEAICQTYRLKQVYSVPNAEPWVAVRPRATSGSEIERLAAGRVKFLFQGRFASARGIEELLDGWAQVDGSRAALFLRGPNNIWREQAIAKAARLGLLDRSIYFLEPVPESQLISAAAQADVGIIPYRPHIINDRLCCPNKLSQYLHAGLPVISNDLPYVMSILTHAKAGLSYDSATPDTLAIVVGKVLDDPEFLPRARENALRFAREQFNWQIHGEALYALYDPVVAAQPAGLTATAAG